MFNKVVIEKTGSWYVDTIIKTQVLKEKVGQIKEKNIRNVISLDIERGIWYTIYKEAGIWL